jgi:flagellar basal body-associated protein FliL
MKDKRILIGGGVALLLAAAFWFYIKPHYITPKSAPVYTDQQIAEAPRPTVQLEERVLNLKAPATAPNYVKAVIALEFADPDHKWFGLAGAGLDARNKAYAEEMKPEMHRIWDTITSVVGSKSVDQVSNLEGRDKLKEELVTAINKDLHKEKVENVFFVTFITQ